MFTSRVYKTIVHVRQGSALAIRIYERRDSARAVPPIRAGFPSENPGNARGRSGDLRRPPPRPHNASRGGGDGIAPASVTPPGLGFNCATISRGSIGPERRNSRVAGQTQIEAFPRDANEVFFTARKRPRQMRSGSAGENNRRDRGRGAA